MNKVLAIVEGAEQDVVKVVTVIGHACSSAEKLLVDGKSLAPEVKAQLLKLVDDAEMVATAVVGATAAKGANWIEDADAVSAVKTLVSDFMVAAPILRAAADTFAKDVASIS